MADECEIVDIKRSRGDTKPYSRTIWSDANGAAQDITSYTFKLTVNEVEDPETSSSTQLFQIAGAIIDATGGIVAFTWSTSDADTTPGEYFYDIEMIDAAGKVWTIQKGRYTHVQDITK